jgi:hypothetical protein
MVDVVRYRQQKRSRSRSRSAHHSSSTGEDGACRASRGRDTSEHCILGGGRGTSHQINSGAGPSRKSQEPDRNSDQMDRQPGPSRNSREANGREAKDRQRQDRIYGPGARDRSEPENRLPPKQKSIFWYCCKSRDYQLIHDTRCRGCEHEKCNKCHVGENHERSISTSRQELK